MGSTPGTKRTAPDCRPAAAALLRDHRAEVVRCAFIVRWAEHHGVDLDRLPAGSVAAEYVSAALRTEAAPLADRLRARGVDPTLKDIEGVFERSLDAGHRRAHGVTYTPDAVIDHLVATGLSLLDPRVAETATVCDPACGSGGFLLRAALALDARHGGGSIATVIAERLVGFDNDPRALDRARCLLALLVLQHGEVPDEARFRLHPRDTLLADPAELRALSPDRRGFDLVATNPPYVRVQSLADDYCAALRERYPALITGSFSLAPLFLAAGHRLLSPDGVLAVITQNNLFTSLAGRPLRRWIAHEALLRRVIDFGHRRVFASASAYTCLLFLGRAATPTFEFGEVPSALPFERLDETPRHRLETRALRSEQWRLGPPHHLANLRRIESAGAPLGELADIRVGFATLLDAVFLVRRDGDACVPGAVGGAGGRLELGATRAVVKVSALTTEADLAPDELRAIFPYEKSDGRYRLMNEPVFAERYPQAYAFLCAHRAALAGRDKGARPRGAWFAWGRAQCLDAPGPKLLTKTFSRGPAFFLDETDRPFCNGYSVALTAEGRATVDLATLQRVLNSAVMHYYARLTSFQIEGAYQCYQKNFIARFAIPEGVAALAARRGEDFDRALCDRYGVPWEDVAALLSASP